MQIAKMPTPRDIAREFERRLDFLFSHIETALDSEPEVSIHVSRVTSGHLTIRCNCLRCRLSDDS